MESTKRTINIALIGSGAMGRAHAAAVANLRYCYNPLPFEAVLHTLVTRDENSAREKADRLGFANYSTDYTAVLENPEIDVIDVCTPNICHYEEVKAALAHGKNVLCEKPLGITAAQAEELAALAEKTDSVCGVVFNNRHLPAAIRAASLVAEGRLGKSCPSAVPICIRQAPTRPSRAVGSRTKIFAAAVCYLISVRTPSIF